MQRDTALKARNLWAEEEDRILRREVIKQGSPDVKLGKPRDWRAIAEKLPGRSNKDCRKRWFKLDSKINKGPWSQEENKRLHEAVEKYTTVWTEVAQVVGTRQPDQCAKRWQHFLDPGLNRSGWTPEEDEILAAEVEKRGRNWKQIVDEVLPRRSANDAKNRFTILQRMRQTTNTAGSSSARQRRPTTSRRTPASPEESSISPSPQPETIPGFYGLTPESMGGNNPPISYSPQSGDAAHRTPISNLQLAHGPDLDLANTLFFQSTQPGIGDEQQTYLGGDSGSTPDILGGEMDADQAATSLESWVDYVMGTGLLSETEGSTPSTGRFDTAASRQISATARNEGDGAGDLMQLDSIATIPTATSTANTITPPTTTTTDPRLPPAASTSLLHPSNLHWNWDEMPALNDTPAGPPPVQSRETETEAEAIRKNRTMILQQMQPGQISRVMDFLLSWNTPIDVKIVNPD
ncbi:hypothetical protein BJY00DRAFT_293593 [Aspergillus carlsbadensis]|nr:hypothetical protein BJY00DRAFT_293593 [Aspergillus carlsbadensis]